MKPCKPKCKFRDSTGLFIDLLFTSIIIFQLVIGSVSSTNECARLTPQSKVPPFLNKSLEIGSGSFIGNLAEEYLTSEKAWNVSASWRVEPNCRLRACDGVYLGGNCKNFSGGNSSPAEIWSSAECKCSSRNCKCSDVHLKRPVCARAYLQPGTGCDSCDAPYTELAPGDHTLFPEKWSDRVISVLVRRGCTLNLYEGEEEDDGDAETIEGPNYKEWRNPVGSYDCGCNDADYRPQVVPTPATTIPSLDIPSTLDDVVTKFSEHNFDHPGLLAALTSLTHKRSSKNLYILTIGSSGAGKSSAINILLDRPNMTVTGEQKSTTSEILEFRIPLPLPELGISNSELRIIDTPGLSDTRGVTKDALFLATLDDYLSGHEELKSRIPNLVLVFHKFDNRFDGDSARFVIMLRGLDTFRTKITDENFSNVIFIFSHFCSETKSIQKNPLPTLMKYKEVIEKYSLFPKPIITAVIENKGHDNELLMKNGNFELPNGEYYPQNLIRQFETATRNGNDKIGNALINAAFNQRRLGEDVTARMTKYDLVSSTGHSKVSKYLKLLTTASLSIANTAVSKLLAEAFDKMSPSLKAGDPNCLKDLQRKLHIRNIFAKADVPRTSLSILELLNELGRNDAYAYLLEHGLNLKSPAFPSNTAAGYSYSLVKDALLPATPFKLDELKTSTIGFLTPNALQCISPEGSHAKSTPSNKFKTFDQKDDYFKFRMERSLGTDISKIVNNTEMFNAVTGKIKDGYFVKDISCGDDKTCSFVVPRDYKRFEFTLGVKRNKHAKLTPEFIQRVNGLQEFDQSNHENVEKWKRFFSDYGTHVVVGATGGGRIQFRFSIPSTTSPELAVSEVTKSVEVLDDLLPFILKYKQNPKDVIANASTVPHTLIFNGGNQAYHISDLTKLTLEEALPMFRNWKRSLDFYPAVFPLAAVPLSEVIESFISEAAAEKFMVPFRHLLTSTLTYIPPPPPTPDPKILEEIARQQREAEEKIKQLEAETKRKAEEAENRRLAEIEAQRKREEERKRAEEQRARELKELEDRRRREEEERQRQLRAEEDRLRREREEAARRHREHVRWLEEQARLERERIQREHERWEEEQRRRRRSCLKKGTKILLADYTEKPVELLKIGDVLLDQELKPTRLLGLSYEFLLKQTFHGFDNNSFFFTDTHLFVGKNGENDPSVLYTTSTKSLYIQSPLMEYLNVREFCDPEQNDPECQVKLINFDSINRETVLRDISLFQEPKVYPEDTPIYFIQVDSPTGTYFAEGFVCRHEVPPVEHWPNTLSILFSLFGTKGFETISRLPYTIDSIQEIDGISDRIQLEVMKAIDLHFDKNITQNHIDIISSECQKIGLENFDIAEIISRFFANPTVSTLGMELYGGSGKIIAKYLDNPEIKMDDCRMADIQNILFDVISKQLDLEHFNEEGL